MPQPSPPTKVKGRLIEDLVERLHQNTGYLIRSRVLLPTLRNPRRHREIDVLATGQMLGRSMHLAFECKNYGQPIGVAKVGEFRDKLEAVGIPVQHGIMIASAHGYTADAQERAAELGIQLLILDGLTNDRLAAVTHDAFQSIVYILLSVTKITIANEQPVADPEGLLFLRDRGGKLQGSVMDLVWAQWRDGHIPLELGEYELSVPVPKHWYWQTDGRRTAATANVTVQTIAYVVTLPGQATHISLRRAESHQLERTQITASFSEGAIGQHRVVCATTEAELQAVLSIPSKVHLAFHRVPLPRITYDMYWPPSERAIARLGQHLHQLVRTGHYDLEQHKLTFLEIEGPDLARQWDPIWSAHPASRDQAWPWTAPRRPRRTKAISTQPRQRHQKRQNRTKGTPSI